MPRSLAYDRARDTSYSELLKDGRYRTAMHYLKNNRHNVEDIAFRLVFSECACFVRAFKRRSGYPDQAQGRMQRSE
jgi:AraC-like DNA-binding protein